MDIAGIVLRDLRPGDAPAAVAVVHAAFADVEAKLDPPPSAARETAGNVVAWLASGGGAVALEGDQIVGVVLWTDRDGGIYVARLAVLPRWQRRGVARALLAHAEAAARACGAPYLHLGTRLALTGNRRLFAVAGFHEVRTRARRLRSPDLGRDAEAASLRGGAHAVPRADVSCVFATDFAIAMLHPCCMKRRFDRAAVRERPREKRI